MAVDLFGVSGGGAKPRPNNNPFASGPVAPAGTGFQPGFIEGFADRFISAFPEMLGYDETPQAAAFEAKNPVSGFIAGSVLPWVVPYAGAMKLARVPAVASRIEGAAGALANPITSPKLYGAIEQGLTFAPLHASMTAAGAALNPDNFGSLFADHALMLGMDMGFGALGGFLRAGGKALEDIYPAIRDPEVSLATAPTWHLRALDEGSKPVNPNISPDDARAFLRREALTEKNETLPSGTRLPYVSEMQGAAGPNETGYANFLFKTSNSPENTSGISRRMLWESDKDSPAMFKAGTGELDKFVQDLGVASVDDIAKNFMYPRAITIAPESKVAGRLNKFEDALTSNMFSKVGDDVWIGREAGDGLFVQIKRLPREKPSDKAVEPGDRFFIGKTDKPEIFAPQQKALQQLNYSVWSKWRPSWKSDIFSNKSMYDQGTNEYIGLADPQDFYDIAKHGRRTAESKIASRLTQKIGAASGIKDSENARRIAGYIYDTLAPTMFRAGRDSTLGRHYGIMSNVMRMVNTETNLLIHGKNVPKRTPGGQVLSREYVAAYGGGITADLIKAIPEADWANWVRASQGRLPSESFETMFKSGELSPETERLTKLIQQNDQEFLNKAVLPALEAAGELEKFNALEGYVAPTLRLGDFGYTIRDANNKPIHIVSGKNGLQAKAHADFVVAQAKEAGHNWHYTKQDFHSAMLMEKDAIEKLFKDIGLVQGADKDTSDLIKSINRKISYVQSGTKRKGLLVGDPGMFKERTGMTLTLEAPSKKEMLAQLEGHYRRLATVAAMKNWTERWTPELMRLKDYSPRTYAALMEKRSQYLGIPGEISKTLNNTLDAITGGKNSATKIANKSNEVLHFLNLGFINPVFALVNSLTPLMTGLPHAAFVLNASRASVSRLNSHVPLVGSDGVARGMVGFLDPLKVLWQGVKDLKSTDAQQLKILGELTDEGTIASKAIEDHVGQHSTGARTLREAFASGGWLKMVGQGSTWMSRKSEEFTRVVSANMGYRLATEHFGMTDHRAIKDFTRRFVENTNYLYGVTDRAKLITGPIGSVAGLFKNWQMHFLGMMTHYAGVAWNERVYSPLIWQTASALAIGGIGSTPLRMAADGLSEMMNGDKESYRWMMRNYPNTADFAWYGLPSFLGMSLQSSAMMPGTDIRNDLSNFTSIVAVERFKLVADALGKAAGQYSATGDNGFRDPNVMDALVEATMPRAVIRAASSVEGDYVKSMRTGYPQVRNVSTAGMVANAFGINPIEIEQQKFAARELYKDQQKRKAWISGLGEAYAQAAIDQNPEQMKLVMQRAVLLQLPLGSVMRSAQNFRRREEVSDILSRYGNKPEGASWRSAIEGDEGVWGD